MTILPFSCRVLTVEVSMKPKTRLLEIQLEIFGNPEPIVAADRHFVYNRICQQKLGGLGKKFKYIHLYIFNDGLLWCSKRGQFKRSFSFKNTNLLYGPIPTKSNCSDAALFIKYGSKHALGDGTTSKSKRKRIQNLRKRSHRKMDRSRTFSLSATPRADCHAATHSATLTLNDHALDGDGALGPLPQLSVGSPSGSTSTVAPTPSPRPAPLSLDEISIEIHHGTPCKKTVIVFVNEKVRDQCLEKIKITQTKYLKRCQRELQRKRYSDSICHSVPSLFSVCE